jgi:hypothetical protein
VGERQVAIRLNEERLAGQRIDAGRREIDLKVILKPGINRIDLDSTEPAVRLSGGPGQLRAFALHEAVVIADASAPPNL